VIDNPPIINGEVARGVKEPLFKRDLKRGRERSSKRYLKIDLAR